MRLFGGGKCMREYPVPIQFGELSRLIPVLRDGNKEDRATSVLLAAIRGIPKFAQILLHTAGQRVGVRSKVQCYSQVVLLEPKEGKLRPDGFVTIEKSSNSWSALIESKIGGAALEKEQILSYVELAKKNDVNAIITISNEFTAQPTNHPIKLNSNEKKKIEIYHWSWLSILTTALLLQDSGDIEDLSQRFLLDEFIRFFEHDSAGVKGFTQMNSEWKELVQKVQSGAPLRKQSDEVINTVISWHQESRELTLILSRVLSVMVQEKLSVKYRKSPEQRIKDDADLLVRESELCSVFVVPDAAADIVVTISLDKRSVTCSMSLSAPEARTNKAQIKWLIKQLTKSSLDVAYIRAWPKASPMPSQATLAGLRENTDLLIAQGREKNLFSRFEIALTTDLAGKFSGSKVFIERVEHLIPAFYEGIGQYLRAYVKPAPRPHKVGSNEELQDNLERDDLN
jgi:hypothetical protein